MEFRSRSSARRTGRVTWRDLFRPPDGPRRQVPRRSRACFSGRRPRCCSDTARSPRSATNRCSRALCGVRLAGATIVPVVGYVGDDRRTDRHRDAESVAAHWSSRRGRSRRKRCFQSPGRRSGSSSSAVGAMRRRCAWRPVDGPSTGEIRVQSTTGDQYDARARTALAFSWRRVRPTAALAGLAARRAAKGRIHDAAGATARPIVPSRNRLNTRTFRRFQQRNLTDRGICGAKAVGRLFKAKGYPGRRGAVQSNVPDARDCRVCVWTRRGDATASSARPVAGATPIDRHRTSCRNESACS